MFEEHERKEKEISINIPVCVECKSLSIPGEFLTLIATRGPFVVMPNGEIIREDPEHTGYFSDAVAKAYAEANSGLFFPRQGSENSFSLADYVSAVKRLVPNDTKRTVLFQQAGVFKGLEENVKFFKSSVKAKVTGMKQDIAIGVLGEPALDAFGELGRGYEIYAGLGLAGFGYNHTDVSERSLSARMDLLGVSEESYAGEIIRDYIVRQNRGRKETSIFDYQFDAEHKLFLLQFTSPALWAGSNAELKLPVSTFLDMGKEFFNVADKVNAALKAEARRVEAVGAEKRRQIAKDLGLEEIFG